MWCCKRHKKRKLKTKVEATETPIVKCKDFCLDQSWQKKPQKSWIGRIFLKKLSRIMSNVFELLVLITSHLPWCVLPFFGVQPLTPLRALKSVPFSGPPPASWGDELRYEHISWSFCSTFYPGDPPEMTFWLFPPPGEIVLGDFFSRVKDGERHFTGIGGVGPKILGGSMNGSFERVFCEIETNFLQHVLQDGGLIQDGRSCFLC